MCPHPSLWRYSRRGHISSARAFYFHWKLKIWPLDNCPLSSFWCHSTRGHISSSIAFYFHRELDMSHHMSFCHHSKKGYISKRYVTSARTFCWEFLISDPWACVPKCHFDVRAKEDTYPLLENFLTRVSDIRPMDMRYVILMSQPKRHVSRPCLNILLSSRAGYVSPFTFYCYCAIINSL